jgi:hypothetical protein
MSQFQKTKSSFKHQTGMTSSIDKSPRVDNVRGDSSQQRERLQNISQSTVNQVSSSVNNDELTRLMTSPNRTLMAPIHQPKLQNSQGKAIVV